MKILIGDVGDTLCVYVNFLIVSTLFTEWSDVRRVYSIGFTYIDLGDGKIDQTTQGVRYRGKFDDNYLIFLSGSIAR